MHEDNWRFVLYVNPTESLIGEVRSIPGVYDAIVEDEIVLRVIPADPSRDHHAVQEKVRETIRCRSRLH